MPGVLAGSWSADKKKMPGTIRNRVINFWTAGYKNLQVVLHNIRRLSHAKNSL